jgi:hypothetical protein
MRALTLILALGTLALAIPASAQTGGDPDGQPRARGRGAYDRDSQNGGGQRWERIELKNIDVYTAAAILGVPVLPTEAELFFLRTQGGYGLGMGAYGIGGQFGGGYAAGQFGGGIGGTAFGSGLRGGQFGGQFGGGQFGGQFGAGNFGGGNFGAGQAGGLGLGAGGPFGGGNFGAGRQGGGLFPGLIILGDPGSNSLIVDP